MPDFKKMPNFAALKNLLTMKNSLVFAYSTHKANRLKPCSDGRILHFMPASMIRAVSAGVKKPSSQNTSMKSFLPSHLRYHLLHYQPHILP